MRHLHNIRRFIVIFTSACLLVFLGLVGWVRCTRAVKNARLKSALLLTASDYLGMINPREAQEAFFLGKLPIPKEDFIALLDSKLKRQLILNRNAVLKTGGDWPIDGSDGSNAMFLAFFVVSQSLNEVHIVAMHSFGNVGGKSCEYELIWKGGKWLIISRKEGAVS